MIFQVRFHPLYPDLLASGSLDHEVRLWNARTAECIGSRDFCKFFFQISMDNIYIYIMYKEIIITIVDNRV